MNDDKSMTPEDARALLLAEKKRKDTEALNKLNAFMAENRFRLIPVVLMRDGQTIMSVEVEALD